LITNSGAGRWESNGLTLSYRSWGAPDAPLMIIHHGFLDQAGAWEDAAIALADDYYVVAMDARGHGDSEWIGRGGAYYFSDYILDLHALLQTLGERPVVLVGHSMGASVVSYYAGAFGEHIRGLVLVDGLGPPHEPDGRAPSILRWFVESTQKRAANRTPQPMSGPEDAARRMRLTDKLLTEARALEMAQKATRPVHGGVVWKFDPLHRARIGVPFNLGYAQALWSQIKAPVLGVIGGQSIFKLPDYQARTESFADYRDVTIPDAGHNVHVHTPNALAAHILEFADALA
jgi:pimeloyl-ACP methyl ester carboxylesterase